MTYDHCEVASVVAKHLQQNRQCITADAVPKLFENQQVFSWYCSVVIDTLVGFKKELYYILVNLN